MFSQGELHALTLALFLPRATLAESPFRFVVLDDPVQAMDPAKVDGLVELLGELAKDPTGHRLLTRRPAASGAATIVVRLRPSSRSNAAPNSAGDRSRRPQDPTIRYLADAHGLIKEWQNGTLSRGRPAADARLAFIGSPSSPPRRTATSQRSCGRGVSIHDLEKVWTDTHATKKRVNLAIFGVQPPEHVAQAWSSPEHRKSALGMAASGFHKGLSGWVDPDDAHYKAKRLVDDIRNGAK